MQHQPIPITAKPVVCLMGARLGTGNMGVGALAVGSITVICSAFPDARIFILDYDDRPAVDRCWISGRPLDIPVVNMRFSKNLFLGNHVLVLLALALCLRMVPVKGFRSFILRRNERLDTMAKTDFCLSIAGGDSFADLYGVERFFYVVLPQVLCLLLQKPLIQMPQTYGPFKKRFVRRIAAAVLARSHAVFARDMEGTVLVRRLLEKQHASKDAVFCYDVGFVLEPRQPPSLSPGLGSFLDVNAGNIVGINISGLLWMGGYNRNDMFGINGSYHEFTRRLIRYFAAVRNTAVLLVPHVFAAGKSREADADVCQTVYRDLGGQYGDRLFFDPRPYDQNEIKYIIGKTSFFIGARMHACIAALSQSIPAVGVAYSKKFKGVLSSIGVEELVVDPSKQTADELVAAIAGLYERRADFAATLRGAMPHVKERVLGLLKGLVS